MHSLPVIILVVLCVVSAAIANAPYDTSTGNPSYQQGVQPYAVSSSGPLPQQPAHGFDSRQQGSPPPQPSQYGKHYGTWPNPQQQQYSHAPNWPNGPGWETGLLSRLKNTLWSAQSALADNLRLGSSMRRPSQPQPPQQQLNPQYYRQQYDPSTPNAQPGASLPYDQQAAAAAVQNYGNNDPSNYYHQYQQQSNTGYRSDPQWQHEAQGGGGGGEGASPAVAAAAAAAGAVGEMVGKVRSYLGTPGGVLGGGGGGGEETRGYAPQQQQQQQQPGGGGGWGYVESTQQQASPQSFSSDGEGVGMGQHGQQYSSGYPQTWSQQQPPPPQEQQPQQPLAPLTLEQLNQIVSPEPQLFVVGDCVVMIMRPREFFRKKLEFTRAGPGALQVFTDFENVMTRFRLPAASAPAGPATDVEGAGSLLPRAQLGERTVSTAELLERSRALLPAAQQQLHAALQEAAEQQQLQHEQQQKRLQQQDAELALKSSSKLDILALDDGDGNSISNSDTLPGIHYRESRWQQLQQQAAAATATSASASSVTDDEHSEHEVHEALTAKCQDIVARDGGLQYASFEPLVREAGHRLGLRAGACDTVLTDLASRSVPTYIFSAGYGDVVTQVLQQSLTPPVAGQMAPALPNNVRVISNFGRSAPDGTVRAFSLPIVHERNKNATTVARALDMPLPRRPHALVLGSQESDVQMTDGLEGLVEQLSIGYMELTEDLPSRLPSFLNAFDAVVIGDGSFQFARSVIDSILQLPSTSSSGSAMSGARALFRRPFGLFAAGSAGERP